MCYLLKVNVGMFFVRSPKRKEIALKFVQIASVIKSETPTLPSFLRAILAKFTVQFNSICILRSHYFNSFSKFSGSHFESIMVNSQRLRIGACCFYLGKLIHFKIKMSLPIGVLSWYFSKQQFFFKTAMLIQSTVLVWYRIIQIYFQTSLFSGFKYFKIARVVKNTVINK